MPNSAPIANLRAESRRSNPIPEQFLPYAYAIVLFIGSAGLGIWPIRKLIQIYEAKHELKRGSAGFIRTTSGWIFIAVWALAVVFCASIIGDWVTSGDLDAALIRAMARLEFILHILAALSDD